MQSNCQICTLRQGTGHLNFSRLFVNVIGNDKIEDKKKKKKRERKDDECFYMKAYLSFMIFLKNLHNTCTLPVPFDHFR